ncbi:MAG: hypothetical protein JSS66_01295 [Armatimonadetes bacterium]|nr:hypothetical protein [Armatimonadota bacterium]
MTWKRAALLSSILGSFVLAGGCGGSGGGTGQKDPVMIVANACSDPGNLAYFFNDTQYGGNLAYRHLSLPFTLTFRSAEEGAWDCSLEEPDRSVQYDIQGKLFEKDTTTICAAVGEKNPTDDNEGLRLLKRLQTSFFNPDRTKPVGNRARLFILHAFNRQKNFNTPDLTFQTFGDNPQFQSDNIVYSKWVTLEVDSGRYKSNPNDPLSDNHFIAKDTNADGVFAENPDVTLKPGSLYVVMISGIEDPNPNVHQNIAFIEIPAKD